MEQKMTTVAVIGAYGFIGKATVKDLLEETDYKVIALSRKAQSYVFAESHQLVEMQIDYYDDEAVSSMLKDVDVVINLAGKMGDSGVTYEMMYKDNVEFVEHILDLCIKSGVKHYIHISTPGVQGLGLRLAKESDQYNPQDDYQKTKMLGEQAVIKKSSDSEMKYTILRPDFVYGVGDERRVKLYRNIKNHRFVLTTSGKAHISPTYVSDVAQGIRKSILNEKAYGEVFNISGEEVQVLEYLNILATAVGTRLLHFNISTVLSLIIVGIISRCCIVLRIKPFVSESQIKFLALDHSTSISKAINLLDYYPKVSLQEGTKEAYEYLIERGLF